MKFITFIAFLILLSACSANKYHKFDYSHASSRDAWIDDFKDQVFFYSLKEAYKSDAIFSMIEKKDALNPYDGLGLDALQKARELGKKLISNMSPPVMCEDCEPGMNYYMATSLHYYASRQLDSIARSEYKKYIQQDRKVFGK